MRLRNLFRPFYVLGRARCWWYEQRHPDHPWLAPGAITWLDEHLNTGMQGFEWGSGRSTLWFALRLGQLTSVEHDGKWHDQVHGMLKANQISNVSLEHIALEHPDAGTYENSYCPLPQYVVAITQMPDESLDFVLVDGWYRSVCALIALPKLKAGGILAIDNTDWKDPPHHHVPKDWPLVHESRNVMTRTSVWRKPALKKIGQVSGAESDE